MRSSKQCFASYALRLHIHSPDFPARRRRRAPHQTLGTMAMRCLLRAALRPLSPCACSATSAPQMRGSPRRHPPALRSPAPSLPSGVSSARKMSGRECTIAALQLEEIAIGFNSGSMPDEKSTHGHCAAKSTCVQQRGQRAHLRDAVHVLCMDVCSAGARVDITQQVLPMIRRQSKWHHKRNWRYKTSATRALVGRRNIGDALTVVVALQERTITGFRIRA